MAILRVESLALVQNAVDAVRNVHGGYQAIDLLTKAMSEVEEPEGFEDEVRQAEKVSGMRYEGPDGATRSLLKTLETAANESPNTQTALVELLSLVLVRLGSNQGSKLLVGLLAIAGVNPLLGGVMVRVLLMLMQSETGRSLVMQAWPKAKQYAGDLWNRQELRGQLAEVASRMGDEGTAWLEAIRGTPQNVAEAVKNTSDSVMESLQDIFLAEPVVRDRTKKKGQ